MNEECPLCHAMNAHAEGCLLGDLIAYANEVQTSYYDWPDLSVIVEEAKDLVNRAVSRGLFQ